MEDDILTGFYSASTVVGPRNPDEVPFHIFGIAKEVARFSVGIKFG
jgi:hypothetical protein